MEIDRFSDRPAYVQIADWLRDRITSGDIEPGARLPSKREVRELTGIGGQTYDRAIAILKDENLIRTARGLGHFRMPEG